MAPQVAGMPKSSWRRGKRLGPEDDPGLRRRFQLFMFPAEISNMGGERIPSKGVKLRWMNSFVGHGGSLDKSTGSITWENPVVISSQVELTKHRYSEEFFPRKEKLVSATEHHHILTTNVPRGAVWSIVGEGTAGGRAQEHGDSNGHQSERILGTGKRALMAVPPLRKLPGKIMKENLEASCVFQVSC